MHYSPDSQFTFLIVPHSYQGTIEIYRWGELSQFTFGKWQKISEYKPVKAGRRPLIRRESIGRPVDESKSHLPIFLSKQTGLVADRNQVFQYQSFW
jgi:hypothetical protein